MESCVEGLSNGILSASLQDLVLDIGDIVILLAVTAFTLIAMAYTHTCSLFSEVHLEAEEFFLAFNESGSYLMLSSASVYHRPLPTNQPYHEMCMQRG
mmetsp:Transcript_42175/g.132862  ORF Transcript_42175/g.132862 Transcript_42175/m.132862 type:complete len:98 (-) Transcript_42175:140-433(-)